MSRLSLAAAVSMGLAAGNAGSIALVRSPGRVAWDLARPESDQTAVVLVEDAGDDTIRVRSALTSGPRVTSNRNPADLEALRAAQLRRERKAARQAKGFR